MKRPLVLPLLFGTEFRSLEDGRMVICGPSLDDRFFRNDRKAILVHSLAQESSPSKGHLDWSNPQVLSSAEVFGYDTFSTELPILRRLQGFSSTVLRVEEGYTIPRPAVITPDDTKLNAQEFELQISSVVEPDLLAEVQIADPSERLLLRANHGCILAVPVAALAGEVVTATALSNDDILIPSELGGMIADFAPRIDGRPVQPIALNLRARGR